MTKEEFSKIIDECADSFDANNVEKINAAIEEFKNTDYDENNESHLAAMLGAKNAKTLLSRTADFTPANLTVNSIAGRDAAYMSFVMDAFKAGQKIQYRLRPEYEWLDASDEFEWVWEHIDYRIKPRNIQNKKMADAINEGIFSVKFLYVPPFPIKALITFELLNKLKYEYVINIESKELFNELTVSDVFKDFDFNRNEAVKQFFEENKLFND